MFTKEQAERNIRLYYCFNTLRESLFWGAILIFYIQKVSGMSLAEIYMMESVCLLVAIAVNIPTGALADLIGRKKLISAGSLALIAMITMFAIAQNKPMIWIANILAFAGFSLISGADSTLLYDTLKFLGRETEHHRILSRSIAYRFYLVAVCSIASGYMAEVNLRWPIYASILPFGICFLISLLFKEPPLTETNDYDLRGHWRLIKDSLIFVANHLRLKWIIAFIVMVSVVSKLWFFTYNPYFELVGLPLKDFGWIFFFLNITAAVSSHFSHQLSTRLGGERSVVLIICCLAVPILLMGGTVSKIGACLVLVQNFVRGYFNPFISDFLQKYLDSYNRATVTSIQGSVSEITQLAGLLAFGGLTGIMPLPDCLLILGSFTAASGTVLWLSYRRIFR